MTTCDAGVKVARVADVENKRTVKRTYGGTLQMRRVAPSIRDRRRRAVRVYGVRHESAALAVSAAHVFRSQMPLGVPFSAAAPVRI